MKLNSKLETQVEATKELNTETLLKTPLLVSKVKVGYVAMYEEESPIMCVILNYLTFIALYNPNLLCCSWQNF